MVYVATNRLNQKRYIGQTAKTLESRRATHEKNARGGRRSRFYSALRKYGSAVFEWNVLVSGTTKESDNYWERMYIAVLRTTLSEFGYNMSTGGDGMSNPSAETRCRMSESHKGHTQNRGRKFSGEIRERMIARLQGTIGHLGCKHSLETKAKMRAAKLGKKRGSPTPETISKMKSAALAREARKRLSS